MDRLFAYIICFSKIAVPTVAVWLTIEWSRRRRFAEAEANTAKNKKEFNKQIAAAGERLKREMLLEQIYIEPEPPAEPMRKATGLFSDAEAQEAVK